MQGTVLSPSSLAAASLPWPAIRPFSPSSRIGLVNPNSLMLAAICATCSFECARGFLAYGTRLSSGRRTILRPSGTAVICSVAATAALFLLAFGTLLSSSISALL